MAERTPLEVKSMKRWFLFLILLLLPFCALGEEADFSEQDAILQSQAAWQNAGLTPDPALTWSAALQSDGSFLVTARAEGILRLETALWPNGFIFRMRDYEWDAADTGEKTTQISDDNTLSEDLAIWLLDFSEKIHPGHSNFLEGMNSHTERLMDGRHILYFDGLYGSSRCTRFVLQWTPEKRVLSYEEDVPCFFLPGLPFEPILQAKSILQQQGIPTNAPYWTGFRGQDNNLWIHAGRDAEEAQLIVILDWNGNLVEIADSEEERISLSSRSVSMSLPTQAQEDAARKRLETEYGYTQEEAAAFSFHWNMENDGRKTLLAAPADHPEWVYSMEWIRPEYEPTLKSPLPGNEKMLRAALKTAKEQAWFTTWETRGQTAWMDTFLASPMLSMTIPSEQDLKSLSPAQALHLLFQAYLGHPGAWTPAAWQWYQEILAAFSLDAAPLSPLSWTLIYASSGKIAGILHQFQHEIPPAYTSVIAHPHLIGWQCHSGVIFDRVNEFKYTVSQGLILFEKEQARMLVMIARRGDNWTIHPIGMPAVLQGKTIRLSMNLNLGQFYMEYETEQGQYESLCLSAELTDAHHAYCEIIAYQGVNRQTWEGFQIRRGIHTRYQPESPCLETILPGYILGYLNFAQDTPLPTTAEECVAYDPRPIPEGYAMISSVYLRSKTSSHAADLGQYQSGTIAKILDILPGTSAPWYHVQIGLMEGYMSGPYVNTESRAGSRRVQDSRPLSVAEAIKTTPLKKDTHLFAGKISDLAPGTRMHILAERGNWLYVAIPEGEPGQFMDVNSTYGYVHKNNIVQAATSLQLDWLQCQ